MQVDICNQILIQSCRLTTSWLKNWPDNLMISTGHWLIIDSASMCLSAFTTAYGRMHLLVSVSAFVSEPTNQNMCGAANSQDHDEKRRVE